ncbi:MAG: hypothetical protein L0220_19300 [Acidobacteria bacterium]|nr:hypothetical protein [Acidobacteriota bacterium]
MFNQSLLRAVLTSILFLLFQSNAPAQSENRSKTIKNIDSLRKQLSEKEKLFLLPPAEDLAAYAEFLKQSNTGLIRLIPGGLFEGLLIMRGGGSYYSFTRLNHEYGNSSDIQLRSDRKSDYLPLPPEYNFVSGFAGANYGFITVLGDIPLEKVTLNLDAVKFLVDYVSPSPESEVRAEKRRAFDGIGKDGFIYKNTVPAIPNHTYVLRSINFSQSDVLVAFRVVRSENDGSVVILWKRLKRFPRPELNRTAS